MLVNFALSVLGKVVESLKRIDINLIEQIQMSCVQIANRIDLLGLNENIYSLSSQTQQLVYRYIIKDHFILVSLSASQT